MSDPEAAKAAVEPLRAALYHRSGVAAALGVIADQAPIRLGHPLGPLTGPAELLGRVLDPLYAALPDAEFRDFIRVAGPDEDGAVWVGCGGNIMGTFRAPFLGIPPTGRPVTMRYHEFYRVEGGRVQEMQGIWDLPELMMQAGVWPMAPSLGRDWVTSGPASQDGLSAAGDGAAARDHVVAMLTAMVRHPSQGGPEIMELDRFWHPDFTWYGPAGIGTMRGIGGFRAGHQIPFLRAMPDRAGGVGSGLRSHFFAQGNYVAVTGWPNMEMSLSGAGWLGLPATGQALTMKSLDFWRVEAGLIRENWVLVDLLDIYRQLGVDVFARMAELGPWPS